MKEKLLQTANVFLDTQAFIALNFQYNSSKFVSLANLIKEGKLNLFITKVTINEIETNIKELVQKAKQHINSIQKDGRILYNCMEPSFQSVFQFKTATVQDHLIKQLHDFLLEVNASIIPLDSTATDIIFDKYFTLKPPFSEKKKTEFPDAFVFASLEKWCIDNDQEMYIISEDRDMISMCEVSDRLISLQKLEQILQIVTLQDQFIKEIGEKIFEDRMKEIEEYISNRFGDIYFWLEDQEGSIDGIDIINVELREKYLTDATNDELYFETIYRIEFKAHVTYDDPDFIFYDKEEGKQYAFEEIDIELERIEDIPVTVQIQLNRKDPITSKIEDISLDIDNGISLQVTEFPD